MKRLLTLVTAILLTGAAFGDALPRGGAFGAGLIPVPADAASTLKLKPGQGVSVRNVVAGQTAGLAGLKSGDVVVSLNGVDITVPTIAEMLRSIHPGQDVQIKLFRDGKPMNLSAKMVERPRDPGNQYYDVIYSEVQSNGNRMRTIVTKPKTVGKHPALFFIQGFAPISYDFELTGPGLDAPILYDFAKSGYVVMRVEKPGVGDSEGGPFAKVDFTTELDIYRQALKQLKGLDYVDTDNVFIFGHSMGGAFGPIIACEIPVKGMVMYGIAARTWHEYLLDILRYQQLLAGASFADIDDTVRSSIRVFDLIFDDGKTADEVKKEHPELAKAVSQNFPDGQFNAKTPLFWKQLLDTNFAQYWTKCNTHVLAVHGESDFVTYDVDHQLVADIVNSVHPGWGKYVKAPSSDHLFNNWKTESDSLKHFGTGTFNPAFIGIVKSWIETVMKG